MPILAVVGIDPTGKREVLTVTVGERENRKAWEDLLDDLRARGVRQVGLWITGGNQAMLNAVEADFPNNARQRHSKHTPALAGGAREMDNVLG